MSEEVKINEENQYSFENPEYRKTICASCSICACVLTGF